MTGQLALFDTSPADDADPAALQLARTHAEARQIAARLPPGVFFGTSSWSFPGWKGLVYAGSRTQTALAREGLREYAQHPLLTTVGVDRSYYAPMPADDLRMWANQLPDGFHCCFKAPASVTSPSIGGPTSGAPNPDFLSVDRLIADLLQPCDADFAVVRLLLRPGTWSEEQRERFKPFNRLVDPDEQMRAEVVAIAKRIVNRGRRVFVLVNNKAEGSSPLTVAALATRLADAI